MTKARTLADNYAADINQVSAGVGITGGGTSGTVTITNDMATSINAKGDLVVGTANDTYSRLAVASTAGYLLTVDSAEATGLKWGAPPASGSLTELATQTFNNTASHTFSSISSSYKFLFLKLVGVRSTTNEQPIRIRFNSDTGTNYKQGSWADLGKDSPTLTGISVLRDPDQGSTACLGSVWIYNYADTGNKAIFSLEASKSLLVYGQIGGWNNTAAITSITIYPASGNLEAGTATLFGGN